MKDPNSPRWLLVTDVDDTLDGDAGSLRELAAESARFLLVLNSSRPRRSVLATMERFPDDLAVDGVVTALGTEILLGGENDEEWSESFRSWDRTVVDELMAREGFEPHPPEMQTPFKASFSVPASRGEEIRAKLLGLLPETRVILSGESDFDAIPLAAGKDKAALRVAERFGVPLGRLVVAGDSGNDLAMFDAVEQAIAVGNARRELLDRADPARTYFAEAGHAAGILEGLRHWGALAPAIESYA